MNLQRLLLAIAVLFCSVGATYADVIENDAVLETWPDGYFFQLIESTVNGGLVAFDFEDIGNGDYEVGYQGIAELIAGFDVELGVIFDTDYVVNNVPLAINTGEVNDTVIHLEIGESFYFGYYDDRSNYESDNPFGPDYRDNFGWAEIARTNTGLELLGSTTAINHGIIVGTTTQTPEPSSCLLLSLILVGYSSRRHRRQN